MKLISVVENYVDKAFNDNGFETRRAVFVFASKITVTATTLAISVTIMFHYFLYLIGMLNHDAARAMIRGIVITAVVAGFLSFSISYIVGMAVHRLWISRSDFERLSRTDMLSGLLNRRAFLDEAKKADNETSLILFDIDRFKAINDSYGHDIGDLAIKAVAEQISRCFEGCGAIARIGGEEFAVLVRATPPAEALKRARHCLVIIAKAPVQLGPYQLSLTLSAGVADFEDCRDFEDLYKACDRALYLAKASGRNCAVHSDEVCPNIAELEVVNHAHL